MKLTERERAILEALDRHQPWPLSARDVGIAAEIPSVREYRWGAEGGVGRTLSALGERGLVVATLGPYYPGWQRRRRLWQITDAGRAAIEKEGSSDGP